MPPISDTTVEMIQWVFPEHAGAPGQIHGGRMMQWIAEAGTLAASRVARGTVVLGAMDDIDFLQPVKVGEIAILRAQVESVGRSSLEVGVRVWSENVVTGARAVTLNSHLVFVSVDESAQSAPGSRDDRAPGRRRDRAGGGGAAPARAAARSPGPAGGAHSARRSPTATADARWRFESVRSVLPEDALFGNMMFPGKMLMDIDEAGGILSMRYCRGFVMTACLDALDFYSPIWSHEVVTLQGPPQPRGGLVARGGGRRLRREAVDGGGAPRLHRLPHLRAPRPRPAPAPMPPVHPGDTGRAAALGGGHGPA